MTGARTLWWLLPLLAACQPLPVITPSAVPLPDPARVARLASEQRASARALEAADRPFEAVVAWERLRLYAPHDAEATLRRLLLKQRIDAGVRRHREAGAELLRHGNLRAAELELLRGLALAPDDAGLLADLRMLSERRAEGWWPAPAGTVAGMPVGAGEATPAPPAKPRTADPAVPAVGAVEAPRVPLADPSAAESEEGSERARMETAAALAAEARQRFDRGDVEAAAELLDRADALSPPPGSAPPDPLHAALADHFYTAGGRAYSADLELAIRLWERCLRFDPTHKLAGPRLDRAYKVRATLSDIDAAD